MAVGLLYIGSLAALLTPATIPNFRDVGGLPAANGRVMRSGLLHRSASPANASRAEADAVLQTLGVRTVLDLRGEKDATKDNGPRFLQPTTRYQNSAIGRLSAIWTMAIDPMKSESVWKQMYANTTKIDAKATMKSSFMTRSHSSASTKGDHQ